MKYTLKNIVEKPFLHSKNNIVVEVNNEFINLTGYFESDLIGKSLRLISGMLRINSQVNLENIENKFSCYIFTKDYEPKEITISCKKIQFEENEKIYFFKEKPDSGVKEKFDLVKQLYADSKTAFSIISASDLILLKANENYFNFFEEPYNKIENSIGKKHKEILTEHEFSEMEEIWNCVITTGKPYHAPKFQYNSYKRGVSYWNISIVPIFIEGKLKYIINKMLDVTEQLKKDEVIIEQKLRLEAVIENMPDAMIFIDKNGDYSVINHLPNSNPLYSFTTLINTETIFGKSEYYDMDGNLLSYEDMPAQRVKKGEKISGYIMFAKNKYTSAYVEVTGSTIYDKAGNFIGGVTIYHDVTGRIKDQKNLLLKTQYNLLNIMIENFDLGFVRCSYPDYKIININPKVSNDLKQINSKLEFTQSVIGQDFFNTFMIDERVEVIKILQKLIEKKRGVYFKTRKFIMKGKEEFFKIMYQPLFSLDNQIVEIVVIAIDITKEVKSKNIMEANLKIQSEVFANISHELKTPLNVIFCANQLIELYIKNNLFETDKEKVFNSINIIKQNGYRMMKLINNIIDTSKMKSGFFKLNMSNQNIVQITEDIVQSVADFVKEKGLSIIFDTNTEEKVISCDPDTIERIILNIISNAIKFTNPGGSIFVNLIDKGSTVEISVKDTGIGIEKKYLDTIFERFQQVDKTFSRNAEGSGIGLYLVKSITEMHGGKIGIESEVGKGSIFKIELPARILENSKTSKETKHIKSKIEMINIEFSDIYSI